MSKQILFFIFFISFFSSAAFAEGGDRYELKSGDKIKISIYGEDDLTLETRINNDNIIRFPFLGNINIKAMTIAELEKLITKRLDGDYLIDPNVYVSVIEYRHFFIRGEVNAPGSYPFTPGLTVQKAISVAGGFTDHAAEGKIFIAHEHDVETKLKVGLTDKVAPGDIGTVKESYF